MRTSTSECFLEAAFLHPSITALLHVSDGGSVETVTYKSLAKKLRSFSSRIRSLLISPDGIITDGNSISETIGSNASPGAAEPQGNVRSPLLSCACGDAYVVGIAVPDGPELVLAVMATLIAGAIVVPLDANQAPDRLRSIVADCRPQLVLVRAQDQQELKEVLGNTRGGADVSSVDGKAAGAPPPMLVVEMEPAVSAHEGTDAGGCEEDEASVDDLPCLPRAAGGALSHVYYTSGSTGTPKGCMVAHDSLLRFAMAKNSAHGIRGPGEGVRGSSGGGDGEGSRVFQASAHTFDVAIGDIVATLACGATLCTASRCNVLERLGWCLKLSGATHITTTPSCWSVVGAEPPDLPHLQVVALGGEPTPPSIALEWAPHVCLLNTYGVTECTVYQTAARITLPLQAAKGAAGTEPSGQFTVSSEAGNAEGVEVPGTHQETGDIKTVGVPLPGVSVAVVSLPAAEGRENKGCAVNGSGGSSSNSSSGGLVPNEIGQPGEVVIGGGQVGVGYLGLPDETLRCFVDVEAGFFQKGLDAGCSVLVGQPLALLEEHDCIDDDDGRPSEAAVTRVYRTGDLGVIAPVTPEGGGGLKLIGRIDDQIKVNGNRVECSEIEAALCRSPLARAAAVRLDNDTGRLVAFVVLEPEVEEELQLTWEPPMHHDDDGSAREARCEGGTRPSGDAADESSHANPPDAKSPLRVEVLGHSGAAAAIALVAARSLVSAVMPGRIGFIPRLPLSANGKLARGRLDPGRLSSIAANAAPGDGHSDAPGRQEAPSGPTEEAVAQLWGSAIGLPAGMIGPGSDFFLSGGDSLRAMRLSHRLRALESGQAHGGRLAAGAHGDDLGSFAVGKLYEHRTLRSFAAYLEAEGASDVAIAAAAALHPVAPITNPQQTPQQAPAPTEAANENPTKHAPDATRAAGLSAGEAALLRAAGRGQRRLVSALLGAGVPWDCGFGRSCPGTTPLLLACGGGHADAVRILLAAGANPNSVSPDGRLPVHAAASASSRADGGECVRLLLEAGVQLRTRDRQKQSILHHAARVNNIEALRLALDLWGASSKTKGGPRSRRKGDGVDWPDRWGRTPLHWAAVNGHLESCKALIAAGADPCTRVHSEFRHSKMTSLALESPLEAAERIHGPSSPITQELQCPASAAGTSSDS